MDVNINVTLEFGPHALSFLSGGVKPQLDKIGIKVDSIITMETILMIQIQKLLDAVNNETTVDKSVLTLINELLAGQKQLQADLAAAVAANDPVAIKAVQDAIDASIVTMQANAKSVSDAVTANTPVPVPAPPPAPGV